MCILLCVMDHNFWTANSLSMYDSFLERIITGLKHTWKLERSKKSGDPHPPPLPLDMDSFIFLAEYQENMGYIRRFMAFFVVNIFLLPSIFQMARSKYMSTTISFFQMTLKQSKQEGMALIWIVFWLLANP